MTCGIQYHQTHPMMSSDVILDTVPCLSYRPSSRPRPVIISYRIPDDTATQSITCDTGYDDTSPISSPYRFSPRFPPHRVARRVGSRHDAILFAVRSVCLPASFHLIGSSVKPVTCPPLRHMRLIHLIHLIRSATSHRLISRPAQLPALLPAERPASSPHA